MANVHKELVTTFRNDHGRISFNELDKTLDIYLFGVAPSEMGCFKFGQCFKAGQETVISILQWQYLNARILGNSRTSISKALGLAMDYSEYLDDLGYCHEQAELTGYILYGLGDTSFERNV